MLYRAQPQFKLSPLSRFRFASQIDASHSHGTTGGNELPSERRKEGRERLPLLPCRKPAHFLQTSIFTTARDNSHPFTSLGKMARCLSAQGNDQRAQVLYSFSFPSRSLHAFPSLPPHPYRFRWQRQPVRHCNPHFPRTFSW